MIFSKQRERFVDEGFASFPSFFDDEKSRNLLSQVLRSRNFEDLFLSEDEFQTSGKMTDTNPRPGRNLAEKLDTEFIFGSPQFSELMKQALGNRYKIMDYKFVVGIPTSRLPQWLRQRIADKLVNNLGPYVKPAYRDITYFHGIDYHQDIIDYPNRCADFITIYVYLGTVTKQHAPLHVLPGSHALGCSVFPHNILKMGNKFKYCNDLGKSVSCDDFILTGGAGDMSLWHAAILHGTQPQTNDENRVSLRILAERNQFSAEGCWLDVCNSKISGHLQLPQVRRDLDEVGAAKVTGNTINRLSSVVE